MLLCGPILLLSVDKLRSAYVKSIKIYFRYSKFYVSTMLTELGLYNLDTLLEMYRHNFRSFDVRFVGSRMLL